MIKKFILAITVIVFLFSFNASAKKMEIVKSIEPQGEFYVYGENNPKLAEILAMDEDALKDYCSQSSVAYLAVNGDNTKQIKVTSSVTDFSNSVINISGLSNDSITALIPDITGIENAKGEVILKDGQKFVKTQFKTSDSGGEYILTQYFTVANRLSIVLSFYTEASADTDYIESTFQSFVSPLFIQNTTDKGFDFSAVLFVAAVIFGIACVVIIYTIIRDIKKEKPESDLSEETEENDN